MLNRTLKNQNMKTTFGVAAIALAFAATSAHPASVLQAYVPLTIAQAGQPGSTQSDTGTGTANTSTGSGTSALPGAGSSSSSSSTGTGSSSGRATTGTGSTDSSSTSGTSAIDKSTTAGASGTAAAGAASSSKAQVASADRTLMRQFALANVAEIEMSKLAQTKSQNDQVKTYAQRLIDDHTNALNELTQLAQSKGVELPNKPDAQHQATMKKLSALSGAAFDKQFIAKSDTEDHRKTHALLTKVSTTARDPELKALAQKTLPAIDQHMKLARDVSATTGPTSSGK